MADEKKAKGKKDDKPAVYNKRSLYKVEGGKVVRLRRNCPKCGAGVFLGQHKDRFACGHCGHTEFIKKAGAPAA